MSRETDIVKVYAIILRMAYYGHDEKVATLAEQAARHGIDLRSTKDVARLLLNATTQTYYASIRKALHGEEIDEYTIVRKAITMEDTNGNVTGRTSREETDQ